MKILSRLGALILILLSIFPCFSFAAENIPEPPTATNATKTSSFERKAYGVVDVLYNTGKNKKVKLIIEYGNQKYIYNLKSEKRYITFPMQLGNGQYSLVIYENTSGTKYRKVYSSSGKLSLADNNIVFLNSVQQVEWTSNDTAVKYANDLLEDYIRDTYGIVSPNGTVTVPDDTAVSDAEIIDLYYNWVVQNLTYDYDKIQTLTYDYVPDIDEILEARGGICYDYSVLLASMLRSQGIPSRLIKGYTNWTSVYHAWNEIYLKETDEWVVVDTTYDSYLYHKGKAYSFEKSKDVYTTSYYY